MPILLVAVSAHGYGHLSQIAPILDGLYLRVPGLNLIIQTEIPKGFIEKRLNAPFQQVLYTADIGILMAGPTVIRWEDTLNAYRDFHQQWAQHIDAQKRILVETEPTLVLCDVPYLPLSAAADEGIDAVAYSSLNWVDIIEVNRAIADQMRNELAVMRETYQSARRFIQPEPSMPMSWLENRRAVGPVMRIGRNIRDRLDRDLGLGPKDRLVLVSLGGIPLPQRLDHWPKIPGVHWLVADSGTTTRDDVHPFDESRYDFIDVLASADLAVSKPGYGMFTEIAALGVPTLNIARSDWGESAILEEWLGSRVALRTIPLEQLLRGDIKAEVEALLSAPKGEPVAPTGIEEATNLLAPLLS